MTKRELSHAFDPFFTTKQTGSGLGLYLSQKIIAEMAGRIDIVSKPGDGTQVIICLPKTQRR
jgi:two-component system, sporulation sensor kinase D